MSPLKSSNGENEYFARQEALKLRKLALKAQEEMAEDEKKKLKELHYMHCPKCGMKMQEIQVNSVSIDKCFTCGGLYFDAGELEKVSGREGTFFKSMGDVFEG
ncbi:MAG TPA: zf-TFIIB domain-containing protein [Myxococcota bacterium]|nr:zf-TFIIB domain-containing protein [Myxococcota bacterium]HRY93159.1 zf-TFIIB domain-containing protein [Myxococcota bacterium]HSA22687.1 zf-TFIIB domain-containing protein [Myxococcota bacterium]